MSLKSATISAVISLTESLLDLMTSPMKKSTSTDLVESDDYRITSYFNGSVSNSATISRTARNMANIDRLSFIAKLPNASEFCFVEKVNQFYDVLRTMQDKHVPSSQQNVKNHN